MRYISIQGGFPLTKTKISEEQRKAKVLTILEDIYQGSASALEFNSVFQLLVAVILSAQTNDNQVNKITRELFARYSKPEDFASLVPQELEQMIKTCGLYKNKAKNIIAAARKIISDFDGQVPQKREDLMLLPGVGRKTANVILSVGYDIPALAVDTHVFRTAQRLGLAAGKTPEAVEQELCSLIPPQKWGRAHHWLIWHGRKLCKAQNPLCRECPLAAYCKFKVPV